MTFRDKAFLTAVIMSAPHMGQHTALITALGCVIIGAIASFGEPK